MMKSMTAFGRARCEGEGKNITVEIKSVNSRFFDCTVKLPRAYLFLEERIKEHVRHNATSRAKVDVYVTVEETKSAEGTVGIDEAYAESYIAALRSLSERFGLTVLFSKPDKKLYLEIIHELADRNNIKYDKEKLDIDAEAFALRRGYRSARCAEQFINSLL